MEDILIPLLTFLLVIGSSFFRNKSKENDQNQKTQKQRPVPKQSRDTVSPYTGAEDNSGKSPTYASAFEENKESQMDRLRETLHIDSKSEQRSTLAEADAIRRQQKQKKIVAVKLQKVPSIGLKNQLTKKGLRRSIIMAEVLSPPRAKRTYASTKR